MSHEIQVHVIEDNRNYLHSLKQALELMEGVAFAGGFNSVESYQNASPAAPQVLLLDINLPGSSGLESLPTLKAQMPQTEVIMLTQNDNYAMVLNAIQNGATGYILKGGSLLDIRRGILDVHAGASVLDPRLSRLVLNTLTGTTKDENPLTSREADVLNALADGCTKKEVAQSLGISYHTVDLYTRNIYEKLKSPNIAAAIATAIRQGLI